MIIIDNLLKYINEDKHTNPTTTSNKFKRDLWEYCVEYLQDIPYSTAVELGTHKGQSSFILGNIFDYVHTCNLPGNFEKAKELNKNLDNINYVGIDLYNSDVQTPFTNDCIDLFLIDAGHSYDNVITDFTRAMYMNHTDDVVFVFDDYGLIPDVRKAIDDLVDLGKIKIVKYIGHEPNYDFKNGRVLVGWEGVICKLNFD
jgi:hypothetical protein